MYTTHRANQMVFSSKLLQIPILDWQGWVYQLRRLQDLSNQNPNRVLPPEARKIIEYCYEGTFSPHCLRDFKHIMVANTADCQKWSAHHPFSNCSISPLAELMSTPFEQCWNLIEAVLYLPYLQLPSHCFPFPFSLYRGFKIPNTFNRAFWSGRWDCIQI